MRSKHSKIIVIAITIGLIFIVVIIVHRPSQSQAIPFSVFEEGYSLIVTADSHQQKPEPPLIIIADPEDMKLASMFTFPEPLAERMKQIDFEKSFVIMVQRGYPDRGLVKAVTRHQETVVITTFDVVVDTGNYALKDWTQPYEFIKIDKDGEWGEPIRFVLRRETQGVLGETVHFIP